jgi:hypothetical protein
VKANQKTLHRQIRSQFYGKRKITYVARDHEISHGRTITWTMRAKAAPEHIAQAWIGTSWIVEVVATGTRDGKPFQAIHLFLTSLRTTPEALLQLVRERWRSRPGTGFGTPSSMRTATTIGAMAPARWPRCEPQR